MATYGGDRPAQLEEALESMFCQTLTPRQLVLTIDGPIGVRLEQVISRYERDDRIADVIIHRLPTNLGLANALSAGLERCTGDWIMRMDSDDIATIDRVEVQTEYALEHPDVTVIGSWCEEFFDETLKRRERTSPVTHDAIMRALRWRCVLVHPTILIRTAMLRKVGGYRSQFGRLEDYDLYVRLALRGARFRVIPKVLLQVRVSDAQITRRGGLRICWNEVRFRTFCWTNGFLSFRQYIGSTVAYLLFRMIRGRARMRLYHLVRGRTVHIVDASDGLKPSRSRMREPENV
jgi:glycosyltransferase involved in cell wall biosynthesis